MNTDKRKRRIAKDVAEATKAAIETEPNDAADLAYELAVNDVVLAELCKSLAALDRAISDPESRIDGPGLDAGDKIREAVSQRAERIREDAIETHRARIIEADL